MFFSDFNIGSWNNVVVVFSLALHAKTSQSCRTRHAQARLSNYDLMHVYHVMATTKNYRQL